MMIMRFFKKTSSGTMPHNTAMAAPLPAWPWSASEYTEDYVRGLVKSRVRFLRGTAEPEIPNLSGILEEMGRTQPQRLAIARLWREEVNATRDHATKQAVGGTPSPIG